MGTNSLIEKGKGWIKQVMDRGNKEISKYRISRRMTLYSKPILGGFLTKQVFLEEGRIYLPIEDFKNDISVHGLFGLEGMDDIFVITNIEEELHKTELKTEKTTYHYDCYEIKYDSLHHLFYEETQGLPVYSLTEEQNEILQRIYKEVETKLFIAREKKDIFFRLWTYFIECITYRLKQHYLLKTFVRIAEDCVEDFSNLLLTLFV